MVVYARSKTSAISSGGNLGAEVDLEDAVVAGVIMDSAWDTGDELGFKVASETGGTYVPLYDKDDNLVSRAVVASQAYSLDPLIFAPWRFVKPWSQNGSGSNAAQTGATTVTFVLK